MFKQLIIYWNCR